jgi:hypothetical protein
LPACSPTRSCRACAFNGGKAYDADADGMELPDSARDGIVRTDGTILSAG